MGRKLKFWCPNIREPTKHLFCESQIVMEILTSEAQMGCWGRKYAILTLKLKLQLQLSHWTHPKRFSISGVKGTPLGSQEIKRGVFRVSGPGGRLLGPSGQGAQRVTKMNRMTCSWLCKCSSNKHKVHFVVFGSSSPPYTRPQTARY